MAENKNKRKPNFTLSEISALSEGVSKRYKSVSDKFSASVSSFTKQKAWEEILFEVNAVSSTLRTVPDLKKKYQLLKSEVKGIESSNRREINKTGGGSANLVDLDENQQIILETIAESQIVGIKGAIDLYEKNGFEKLLRNEDEEKLEIEIAAEKKNLCIENDVLMLQNKLNAASIELDMQVFTTKEKSKKGEDVREGIGRKLLEDKFSNKSIISKLKSSRDLQEEQVCLLKKQVEATQKIADFLEQLVAIQKEKLNLEKSNC